MPEIDAETSMEEMHKSVGDLVGIRILVIMPSIPIQGMERANLQIMKMMRERGADVLFITNREYGKKVRCEVERIGCSWRPASCDKRLHLTKSPREMAAVLGAWAKVAWEIDRVYREYKPTHIYATNLSYFLFALPTLLRAKVPVIFRPPNPPDTNLPRSKQRLSNWIWRFVTGLCDVIVCNSRYTLSQIEKVGVKRERTRVIYNCVSERSSVEASDAPEVNPNHFNVVFLGHISRAKGVKELFDVARRLAREREHIDFYFAGEYQWENPFADALTRQVREENLQSRVHFIGEIRDVFGLLARCDLHVWPSISGGETFPNVVLEAKSQRVPSVAFPTASLPEVVTHLVDGYVCRNKSIEDLYEGIRYFLDNRVALKVAGEAAKQSLERFSRERISNEWANVFMSYTLAPQKCV